MSERDYELTIVNNLPAEAHDAGHELASMLSDEFPGEPLDREWVKNTTAALVVTMFKDPWFRELVDVLVAEVEPDPSLCARCGKDAAGFAGIDGERYCHEGPSPTCYELGPA